MKSDFKCARCGSTVMFTEYVKHHWDSPVPIRCPRCGAAHACLRGDVEVISRPMMPSDFPHGVVSPWMLWKWRPVAHGTYECRFRECTVFLWWNGRYFQAGEHDARAVQMATLQAWRGVWA